MTIVAIVMILLAVCAGLVWGMGSRSQQPRKLPNSPSPQEDASWQSLTFYSKGSKLEGWMLKPTADLEAGQTPSEELSPVVVVAHGWGSNRTRVLRYAGPLLAAGYTVFMYDARSHGDSESIKAPSALMFRDDVIAAVEKVKSLPRIDPDRVAVLGHSLGGFGALLALEEGLRVNAIVTDSMPVHFETMLRAELKRKKLPMFPLAYVIPTVWLLRSGITREQYRRANIPAILSRHAGLPFERKQPLLMIHSLGDSFIPSKDLRRLEEMLPQGIIQTLYVNTEGHSSSERDPVFWRSVLPFLEQGLGARRSSLRMEG